MAVGTLVPKLREILSLNSGRRLDSFDAERGQAIVRVVLVPTCFIYLTWIFVMRDSSNYFLLICVVSIAFSYIPVSLLLLVSVLRRPGYNFGRRLIAMASDYSGIGFAMSAGGAGSLPVFAVLLWVTVGYGIRYGSSYLLGATACALASLAVTTVFNAYWQHNLFLPLTLIVTTVLVPAYVFNLLRRVHQSHRMAIEANAAKSRFLAHASHDLRQPIHAISLFTACLRDSGVRPEQLQMVENIDRSLQSVSGLFRSLLDISSLDSGKVALQFEPVCLRDLIGDIVRQNSQAAQWAGVTLKTVSCNQYVSTDPVLLTTMIQNILTNAYKYAPQRPVLIGCRRRGGMLAIEIYDRGPGMKAEHLERVFDEFYQIRKRGDRDIEGVGLGLSIVQRMASLLGLTVSIRSVENHGTAVVIAGLRIVDKPIAQPMTERLSPGGVLDGLRVLLIEDNVDVLRATAALLQRWGCIVQAETSKPGLPCDCDIILTDFDLGSGTTGGDCIAEIRKAANRKVPAIVMTGHEESRVREELADPSIAILAKPLHPAELRSMLSAMRSKHQQEA